MQFSPVFLLFILCSLSVNYAYTQEDSIDDILNKSRAKYYVDASKQDPSSIETTKAKLKDFEEAFQQIISEDSKAKVYVIINGIMLKYVVKFKVLASGTSVMINYKSGSKIKTKVVDGRWIQEMGVNP